MAGGDRPHTLRATENRADKRPGPFLGIEFLSAAPPGRFPRESELLVDLGAPGSTRSPFSTTGGWVTVSSIPGHIVNADLHDLVGSGAARCRNAAKSSYLNSGSSRQLIVGNRDDPLHPRQWHPARYNASAGSIDEGAGSGGDFLGLMLHVYRNGIGWNRIA